MLQQGRNLITVIVTKHYSEELSIMTDFLLCKLHMYILSFFQEILQVLTQRRNSASLIRCAAKSVANELRQTAYLIDVLYLTDASKQFSFFLGIILVLYLRLNTSKTNFRSTTNFTNIHFLGMRTY